MPIITIDGNIGSYKTSLLNFFHKTFKIAIDLEPVESWHEYLNNMYTNEKDNTYNFQIKVWMDRCWIQEKSNVLVLMERSPYFIQNVFIEKAYEDQTIDKDQYKILQSLHKKTSNLWRPDLYIYLCSEPEMCMQRIVRRGRQSEKNIKLEYIQRMHDMHEEKLADAIRLNMNVLVIDVENKSIGEICAEIMNSSLYTNIAGNCN
jgi:deoxyadenosine/deoxycytidine kinase